MSETPISHPLAAPVSPAAASPDATIALEDALARLEQLATPRITVEGGRFRRIRIAAQRGLYRLLRPLWFQQRLLHTELISAMQQVTRGLRQEREARLDAERRLERLAATVASAKGDIGRVGTQLSHVSKQAQERAVAGLAGLANDIVTLNGRVDRLTASLASAQDERIAQAKEFKTLTGELTAEIARLRTAQLPETARMDEISSAGHKR
jgi:hypothetical protein